MSSLRATYTLSPHTRLEITQGDLTQEPVDAIVNAANAHLAHGGGVAGAIVRAGGWSIQQESNEWVRQHGPVSHAEPAYTRAGKLPSRYIIHAVGPVWHGGSSAEEADRQLAAAVHGSLLLAEQLKLTSIAFPAISSGIFGFPKDRAARIFIDTFQAYFSPAQPAAKPDSSIQLVRLTLWDEETLDVFLKEAHRLANPSQAE